jgi:hypothetical protein
MGTAHRVPAAAVAYAALVALAVGSAAATPADPTPTPAPTRTPIVITNENLADYAARGHVTSAETATSNSAAASQRRPVHRVGSDATTKRVDDAVADAPRLAEDEKKNYWRSRYEQQLALVASIEEQITVLDREIPGLWRQFYAWDDPAYRDGVIKVQLDQALERSERLKGQLEGERANLDEIRQAARKDGAQPGWFRGLDRPTPTATPTR